MERTALRDLVVITGFSGAGKSTVMNVFEDGGYFCVDNLPPDMIASLADLFMHEGSKVERAAVVCDARGGELFGGLVGVLDLLRERDVAHRVLFLEADEQTLLNRFKETRRRHPVSANVLEGIAAERAALEEVRGRADLVLDTTGLSASALRRRIADELLRSAPTGRMAVTFESFGFKNGPARDADLVFDARFLSNPHYVAELRPLTGRDASVVEYINRDGELDEFVARLIDMLDYLLPRYVAEGKSHLVVGIGCTGGRHRSVAIAERLARHYSDGGEHLVEVAHRDLDRSQPQ